MALLALAPAWGSNRRRSTLRMSTLRSLCQAAGLATDGTRGALERLLLLHTTQEAKGKEEKGEDELVSIALGVNPIGEAKSDETKTGVSPGAIALGTSLDLLAEAKTGKPMASRSTTLVLATEREANEEKKAEAPGEDAAPAETPASAGLHLFPSLLPLFVAA